MSWSETCKLIWRFASVNKDWRETLPLVMMKSWRLASWEDSRKMYLPKSSVRPWSYPSCWSDVIFAAITVVVVLNYAATSSSLTILCIFK